MLGRTCRVRNDPRGACHVRKAVHVFHCLAGCHARLTVMGIVVVDMPAVVINQVAAGVRGRGEGAT